MYGPQYVCTFARVTVRATISIYGWLRHDRVQSDHYIRYRRLGQIKSNQIKIYFTTYNILRSVCVYNVGRERSM